MALFAISSFANTKEIKPVEIKKILTSTTKVLKPEAIKVYCNGVYAGSFTCNSCTTQQIVNIALSFCD